MTAIALTPWLGRNKKLLVVVSSGALIGAGLLAGLIDANARAALMIAAAAVAGWPVARAAWTALRARLISIQLLVTIAAVGGIVIGNQWEAAAVTFLFALGATWKRGRWPKPATPCTCCSSWRRQPPW